jgi:hypothetical protein
MLSFIKIRSVVFGLLLHGSTAISIDAPQVYERAYKRAKSLELLLNSVLNLTAIIERIQSSRVQEATGACR